MRVASQKNASCESETASCELKNASCESDAWPMLITRFSHVSFGQCEYM
jgi:hypothetical protein